MATNQNKKPRLYIGENTNGFWLSTRQRHRPYINTSATERVQYRPTFFKSLKEAYEVAISLGYPVDYMSDFGPWTEE